MGTGKSTWIILTIKANPEGRYVVVLPTLDEVKRYEEKLSEIEGLVSLHDGPSKKQRFDEAIEEAQVILTTHSLFQNHLDDESFELVQEGHWKLITDEVITAFEDLNAYEWDILGMCTGGALTVKQVMPGVDLLQPNPVTYPYYKTEQKNIGSKRQKDILNASAVKDLYRFTCDNNSSYHVFSLQEKRLTAFAEVTILTYPFKDTELDYWFQMKGIEVEHLELTRKSKTNSLSDFDLKEHSGVYSGKDFKELIEFLEPSTKGKKYGSRREHFSATSMKKRFAPNSKDKKSLELQKEVRNDMRNIFKNRRGRDIEAEDFMFTCKKDSIEAFRDSKCGLTKDFIGPETFVPFNVTATNKHKHKHHLAFLYNVFPFLSIRHAVRVHGLEYDEDRNALYFLIQWVWRSAIREGEKIYIYLPSKRMRKIFQDWLNA